MNRNALTWVSFSLVVIGALNWGLVGFFHYNLVTALFGTTSYISRIVYGAIGLAAVVELLAAFRVPAMT